MRLQKYIAHCGVTSRRKAEELIKQGRVLVNNEVRTDMGININPDRDKVYVDNKLISVEKNLVYIILNKPEGYITTLSDEFNRPTVIDLVCDITERIYPVGRLDYDTSGLILLTNDGELTYKLTHPKHEFIKTYIANIEGIPNEKTIHKLETGIQIEEYITAPAKFKIIKLEKPNCYIEVKIHEGKNRQIRKMLDAVGHPVKSLKRVAMGSIKLDTLPLGKWRALTKSEISYLKNV